MARTPIVPCEKLLDAIDEFEREVLPRRAWAKWEQNKAHRHAIRYKGRYYPVKKIISIATGLPLTEFGGGAQANGYVRTHCRGGLRNRPLP
jgi:5-methylcytosine-specific restriction protein A